MKVLPTISVCALAACTALAGNAFAEGAKSRPKMAAAKPLSRTALFPNGVFQKGGDPGDDDTAISLAPNLSALCQSYIGQLKTYANPRPNVDQINGDQIVLAGMHPCWTDFRGNPGVTAPNQESYTQAVSLDD